MDVSVLGFSIDTAKQKLAEAGFDVNVVYYEAPHTIGEEVRVIRERFSDKYAELTVSRFKTEVFAGE